MIISNGSTTPITLGPLVSTAGAAVTSAAFSITNVELYVNGVAQAPTGSVSTPTDSRGCIEYTPSAADTATTGELKIVVILSGAMPYFRQDQVAPPSYIF